MSHLPLALATDHPTRLRLCRAGLLPFVGAFVGALGFVLIAFNAGWLRDD
jgi:hypothetical protein